LSDAVQINYPRFYALRRHFPVDDTPATFEDIMCVGIPGKVVSIDGRMAAVEVGGATRSIALDLLDGVAVGDYVIAHAGFAIHKVDEQEAVKTLELIYELMEGLDSCPPDIS
jgi:hydrogenase expression/formation protein HypC